MRMEELTVHIPMKRLLIALCLTNVPLGLFGTYTLNRADENLKKAVRANFEIIAQSGAKRVPDYVHDRVLQVSVLAACLRSWTW